ncbi:hypothetical protein ACLESD_20795 [Pyxidicoccus sp. 3LFB2]
MSYLAAGLLVCACGEDERPEDEVVDYPECSVEEQLVLEGTLDGQPINVRMDSYGHSFSNLGAGGSSHFEIFGPPADASPYSVLLRIDFDKVVRNGRQVPARGVVELVDEGVVAGNCEDDGFTGLIAQSDDGETTSFVLRNLKASPYCGGAARSGELRGCFLYEGF